MVTTEHSAEWRPLIEGCLTDNATAEENVRLRAHLKTCLSCRGVYDRMADSLAAFEGVAGGLPESIRRRQLDALLGAPKTSGSPVLPVLLTVTLAAAAAILGMVILRPPAPPLIARGGDDSTFDFKVYCIEDTEGAPKVVASGSAQEELQCPNDHRIQFTWSSAQSAPRFLALFSIPEHGDLTWYWPQEKPQAQVGPFKRRPIPGSFRLSAGHKPGRYTLYGIASERPINEKMVRQHIQNNLSPEHLSGVLSRVRLEVK